MKKSNKKGFTLAELLIVVAIIAVLTAIAVPLFVGALSDANDAVKAANIRAVRSEATAAIVVAKTGNDPYSVLTDGKRTGPWKFTATVDKNGKVTITKPAVVGKDANGSDTCEPITTGENKGGYTVTVVITADDLNSST